MPTAAPSSTISTTTYIVMGVSAGVFTLVMLVALGTSVCGRLRHALANRVRFDWTFQRRLHALRPVPGHGTVVLFSPMSECAPMKLERRMCTEQETVMLVDDVDV